MNAVPFNNQKYDEIKRYLTRTGQRFVDPFFPPDNTSLVYPFNSRIHVNGVVWKRPKVKLFQPCCGHNQNTCARACRR